MTARPAARRPSATPRQAAVKIVRLLQQGGYTAYFAGGCVRDTLLGLTPKDYDVATDAQPQRVLELFHNARYVGEAFGVVRVRMMRHDVEVATFRLESGYVDGRRPTQVHFTDAQHDAQRRDFTINGLFENPLRRRKEDRIIDTVKGRADLKGGVIRAIGDASQRFGEDYLRMLRAVRFAARLGFKIEAKTAAAIIARADRLAGISRERIGQEVAAMLSTGVATQRLEAVRLMQRLCLDGPTLDEEHSDPPTPTVAALDDQAAYPTVLAAWLHDRQIGRLAGGALAGRQLLATARRWRRALCLSNDDRDTLLSTLTVSWQLADWSELGIAKRKRLLADPQWRPARMLLAARQAADAQTGRRTMTATVVLAELDRDAEALLAAGVAPEPWITGDDLIALGMQPGPGFRRLLNAAYDDQLDGTARSRADALARVGKQR
jgi:poly(A) polymerase